MSRVYRDMPCEVLSVRERYTPLLKVLVASDRGEHRVEKSQHTHQKDVKLQAHRLVTKEIIYVQHGGFLGSYPPGTSSAFSR